MQFTDFLKQNRPILLDGAVGTLLDERGYDAPSPLWSAAVLEDHPDAIRAIHAEYLQSGAELITTATFRTTRRVYSVVGRSELAEYLTHRAVAIARDAIGDQRAFVAGSVAPLEDCYRPDLVPDDETLYKEHEEQIRWLIEAGVDCLLFETMNTVREGAICSRSASEKNVPFIASFICKADLKLLNGESVLDAYEAIKQYNPVGFLINCTAPETITRIFREYASHIELPVGAYANAGISKPEQDGEIREIYTPREFLKEVTHWLEFDPVLIGGCCGSTPEHIQLISEYLATKRDL